MKKQYTLLLWCIGLCTPSIQSAGAMPVAEFVHTLRTVLTDKNTTVTDLNAFASRFQTQKIQKNPMSPAITVSYINLSDAPQMSPVAIKNYAQKRDTSTIFVLMSDEKIESSWQEYATAHPGAAPEGTGKPALNPALAAGLAGGMAGLKKTAGLKHISEEFIPSTTPESSLTSDESTKIAILKTSNPLTEEMLHLLLQSNYSTQDFNAKLKQYTPEIIAQSLANFQATALTEEFKTKTYIIFFNKCDLTLRTTVIIATINYAITNEKIDFLLTLFSIMNNTLITAWCDQLTEELATALFKILPAEKIKPLLSTFDEKTKQEVNAFLNQAQLNAFLQKLQIPITSKSLASITAFARLPNISTENKTKLQEATTAINELEEKIETLEQEVKELQAKIAAIEQAQHEHKELVNTIKKHTEAITTATKEVEKQEELDKLQRFYVIFTEKNDSFEEATQEEKIRLLNTYLQKNYNASGLKTTYPSMVATDFNLNKPDSFASKLLTYSKSGAEKFQAANLNAAENKQRELRASLKTESEKLAALNVKIDNLQKGITLSTFKQILIQKQTELTKLQEQYTPSTKAPSSKSAPQPAENPKTAPASTPAANPTAQPLPTDPNSMAAQLAARKKAAARARSDSDSD